MMEEANFGQGYAKLSRNRKSRGRKSSEMHTHNPINNMIPPVDSYNAVYLSFILGGAGFLLPYNSFIMAMDYFKVRYPGSPVVFEMSVVYISVACLTVMFNNGLVETFSLNSRINFGYFMSFITLIFVIICEIWWEAFGTATSYDVNLTAVAVVAIGCTVQQSSFYGYTSMLPTRYTQAVMVGESASGVFTSFVRVLTRFLIPEIRGSTIYFFTVSVSSVATCFVLYHLIRRTEFIQFYVTLCETAKTKITLEPTEDAGLMENNDVQFGILSINNSNQSAGDSLSFANPLYEPTGTLPTYKVEDVVIRGRQNACTSGGFASFRRGIQTRWEITKIIFPYMVSICLVYFATLCLYPGLASEIVSCRLDSWMPILMMAMFNGADLFGKILASFSYNWTGGRLVRFSVVRLIMIPLMVMCVAPRTHPIFSSELTAFFFALLLGCSNGILGSVPMIQASTKVEDRYRELTGNLMTLLYNIGLTTGSLMAYCLLSMLGPVEDHPCGSDYIQKPISAIIENATTVIMKTSTASTTALTTLATTIISLRTDRKSVV